MRHFSAAVGAAAGVLLMVSCGRSSASRVDAGGSSAGTTPAITAAPAAGLSVSEADFHISANPIAVATGSVTVAIVNSGPSAHELLVFRTDLPDDQLPLRADGRIDEDALPKMLDTGTDLPSGTQRSLTVPLPPGRYVLVCNLPGHYILGMHTVITAK